MSNAKLTHLGQEIKRLLEHNDWSQRELARRAGIGVANISRVMRGLQEPTHNFVEVIADAFQVDSRYLKLKAGLRVVTPQKKRDPSVEYLAQRLDELPFSVREIAVNALGGQLDAIDALFQKGEKQKAS